MINSMNTLRTHKDSAEFGITEYSDLSHGEFLATKLNRNLTKVTANRQINFITKGLAERFKTPNSFNIIRYTRDTVGDVDSLPMKVDWYVQLSKIAGACRRHPHHLVLRVQSNTII